MKNRLKEIRKQADMTQNEFAKYFGLSRNFIAQVETGKATLGEQTIKLICKEYNYEEDWLRDGKLPKKQEITEIEQMKKIIDDVMESKNEFQRNALYVLATMTPEEWDIVEQFYYKIKKHSKDKADL